MKIEKVTSTKPVIPIFFSYVLHVIHVIAILTFFTIIVYRAVSCYPWVHDSYLSKWVKGTLVMCCNIPLMTVFFTAVGMFLTWEEEDGTFFCESYTKWLPFVFKRIGTNPFYQRIYKLFFASLFWSVAIMGFSMGVLWLFWCVVHVIQNMSFFNVGGAVITAVIITVIYICAVVTSQKKVEKE